MENLLKEEKLVLHCLSLYGCLRWEQLVKLMSNKQKETAEKILNGLRKRQYFVEDEAGYVKLDPRCEPDQKMITAFWILLERISKIVPNAHYAANYPAEIFFLKDNSMYEIVVVNKNEENYIRTLFLENRYNSNDEEDAIKYIIAVPSVDDIESCLKAIPPEVLAANRVLFSTVEFDYDTGEAEVQYYKV